MRAVLIIASFFLLIKTNYAQHTATTEVIMESSVVSDIKVKGITCGNDVKTLSKRIEGLKGVNNCKVVKKGKTSTFKVDYDPALISEKEIHVAIEDTAGCKNPNDRPYKVKL